MKIPLWWVGHIHLRVRQLHLQTYLGALLVLPPHDYCHPSHMCFSGIHGLGVLGTVRSRLNFDSVLVASLMTNGDEMAVRSFHLLRCRRMLMMKGLGRL